MTTAEVIALPNGPDAAATTARTIPPVEHHITLTMHRTGCFGTCPSYRIGVRDDGLVTYEGLFYVKHHGRVVRHVPEAVARALIHEYQSVAAIPEKKAKGNIVVMTSDMPEIDFTLVDLDGTETKLHHDTGNSLSPDEWGPFEKKMDETLQTESLTSCGEMDCPR